MAKSFNNIKNKLIQIAFALVRSKTTYNDEFAHKMAAYFLSKNQELA